MPPGIGMVTRHGGDPATTASGSPDDSSPIKTAYLAGQGRWCDARH